jgi:hypothetical protein
MSQNPTTRKYPRHPTDLPVKVLFEELVASESSYLNNISEGGLSFNSMLPLETGSLVSIRIPINKPVFDFACRVVWCTRKGPEYTIGVEFVGSDIAFRQRVVAMVRGIDDYRLRVQEQEGRHLSSQQAALEWISHYADELYGKVPPAE